MKPVRLRVGAQQDLRNAISWYREKNLALSYRFLAELRRTLELVERFPSMGKGVPSVRDSDVRSFPLHTFPYHVVYVELKTRISVLAIAHEEGPDTGAPKMRDYAHPPQRYPCGMQLSMTTVSGARRGER